MDYIRKFDIELERDYYYAGEILHGYVVVENTENLKVRGVRVFLRGKAHVEWKVSRGGERRTVKEDQYFVDEKAICWGKGKNEEGTIPIMPRGDHKYPFMFQLPESALPCSFESKIGTIRYYLRVVIDIPYASPPQGLKYFTVIGPHIDCMEDRYLAPLSGTEQSRRCCLCCMIGPVSLEATLERSAYCCGENIKLKCEIQNGSDQNVWVVVRLLQTVEYRINKGVLGLTKEVNHKLWEFKGPTLAPHHTESFHDLYRHLQVPVTPPTLAEVCKVLEIYYILRVGLGMEKSGEDLQIDFALDVATVPFRIPNHPAPELKFEVAADNTEGGIYISPEFQLGQVYDGSMDNGDEIILYRPVYPCVPHNKITVTNTNNATQRTPSPMPGPAPSGSRDRSPAPLTPESHSLRETTAPVTASSIQSLEIPPYKDKKAQSKPPEPKSRNPTEDNVASPVSSQGDISMPQTHTSEKENTSQDQQHKSQPKEVIQVVERTCEVNHELQETSGKENLEKHTHVIEAKVVNQMEEIHISRTEVKVEEVDGRVILEREFTSEKMTSV